MIADAWAWHQAHPQGYARLALRRGFPRPCLIHVSKPSRRARNRPIANVSRAMRVSPHASLSRHQPNLVGPRRAAAARRPRAARPRPVGGRVRRQHATTRTQIFSSASSFNTVAVTLTNPGTPLRGTVDAQRASPRPTAASAPWSSRPRRPARAPGRRSAPTPSPPTPAAGTPPASPTACATSAPSPPTPPATRSPTRSATAASTTPAPTATTTDPGSPLTGTVAVTGVGSDLGSGVASTTRPVPARRRPQLDHHLHAGRRHRHLLVEHGRARRRPLRPAHRRRRRRRQRRHPVADRRQPPPRQLAPTATMTAPAANLTGSVTLASTSADSANGSGVASVRYEYKPSAGSTWTTACTSADDPVLLLVRHQPRSATASTTSAPSRSTGST